MPEKSGYQLLEYFDERLNQNIIPRIVISADQDRKTRMNCFAAGADDFISKPIEIEEFIIRVGRQLKRKKLLDDLLLLDELTGAYNRKFLNQVLEQQLAELNRKNKKYTIALLDLDFFKKVNDTYGHLTGDMLLKEFVQFIKASSRGTDSVARYGGEEFVLMMPDVDENEAAQIVDRLRERFSKKIFYSGETAFSAAFSGGIFQITNKQKSVKECLQFADQALYQAKDSGRNCIVKASEAAKAASRVLKVAIIDDDDVIRTLLVDFLNGFTYGDLQLDIADFRDGVSFFESDWYKGRQPYFIILDGNMPRMDGFEVLQRIRALSNSNDFTVMMLTGRKNERDIIRGLDLGADDYLMKPFSIWELEARMKRLLKKVR